MGQLKFLVVVAVYKIIGGIKNKESLLFYVGY